MFIFNYFRGVVFARAFFSVRAYSRFASLFMFLFFVLLYRECGSGARGLIKAPAGARGLAPVVEDFKSVLLGSMLLPPRLSGGDF